MAPFRHWTWHTTYHMQRVHWSQQPIWYLTTSWSQSDTLHSVFPTNTASPNQHPCLTLPWRFYLLMRWSYWILRLRLSSTAISNTASVTYSLRSPSPRCMVNNFLVKVHNHLNVTPCIRSLNAELQWSLLNLLSKYTLHCLYLYCPLYWNVCSPALLALRVSAR